ncbi:MAG: type III pantothenate kinase [Planctomycetota bacterium]|jgi:type III pantothenate kinase
MIRIPEVDLNAPIVAIGIGNTNTMVATWHENTIKTPLSAPTEDHDAFRQAFAAHAEAMPGGKPAAVVIGSVVPESCHLIADYVSATLDKDALVIGDRIKLPMDVAVEDVSAVGVDRVCAAAAAFDRLQNACIIIDFGTAVTVDLVDNDGVFQGGAILPGPGLQLKALRGHTAQLPDVALEIPQSPVGKNTAEAMQNGVCRGVTGAVRGLVESYATVLNFWPQVLATGGDLEMILPYCDFIDTPVENLTIRGIGLAYSKHLSQMVP